MASAHKRTLQLPRLPFASAIYPRRTAVSMTVLSCGTTTITAPFSVRVRRSICTHVIIVVILEGAAQLGRRPFSFLWHSQVARRGTTFAISGVLFLPTSSGVIGLIIANKLRIIAATGCSGIR